MEKTEKKHREPEISANEFLNFASLVLSQMETQNQLLALIANHIQIDRRTIDKATVDSAEQMKFFRKKISEVN